MEFRSCYGKFLNMVKMMFFSPLGQDVFRKLSYMLRQVSFTEILLKTKKPPC